MQLEKHDVSLSSLMRRLSKEGIPEENRTGMARSIRKDIVMLSERSLKKGLAGAIRHKDHQWAGHMVHKYGMSQNDINDAVRIAYIEVRGTDPEPPKACEEIRSVYVAKDNRSLKERLDSFDELVRLIWMKKNGMA